MCAASPSVRSTLDSGAATLLLSAERPEAARARLSRCIMAAMEDTGAAALRAAGATGAAAGLGRNERGATDNVATGLLLTACFPSLRAVAVGTLLCSAARGVRC